MLRLSVETRAIVPGLPVVVVRPGAECEAGGETITESPVLQEWELFVTNVRTAWWNWGRSCAVLRTKKGFHSHCLTCPICMAPWTEEAYTEQGVTDLVKRVDASIRRRCA
jgi:hypothetical protein